MIFSEGCFLKEAPLRLPARTFTEEGVYKRKFKCMRNAEGYVYRKIPNNES
jgi:hypothetical protein